MSDIQWIVRVTCCIDGQPDNETYSIKVSGPNFPAILDGVVSEMIMHMQTERAGATEEAGRMKAKVNILTSQLKELEGHYPTAFHIATEAGKVVAPKGQGDDGH